MVRASISTCSMIAAVMAKHEQNQKDNEERKKFNVAWCADKHESLKGDTAVAAAINCVKWQ